MPPASRRGHPPLRKTGRAAEWPGFPHQSDRVHPVPRSASLFQKHETRRGESAGFAKQSAWRPVRGLRYALCHGPRMDREMRRCTGRAGDGTQSFKTSRLRKCRDGRGIRRCPRMSGASTKRRKRPANGVTGRSGGSRDLKDQHARTDRVSIDGGGHDRLGQISLADRA